MTNNMGTQDKHPHHGHRQRKKEEFILKGISGKPEHEMLEILLFYAVPRGDTNEIAHELINRFGSLKDVINASYSELLDAKIKGVGENAASLIVFFRMLAGEYFVANYSASIDVNNSESLNNYCKSLFVSADKEELRCIFLDDELNLIGNRKICEGTLGKIELPFRQIVEAIIEARCNRVILTHNHPRGAAMPSRADVNATIELWKRLAGLQIELTDHVVVGRDGQWSMRFHGNVPQIWPL